MILPSFLNPTSPSWLSTSLYSIAETDMRISRCKRRLGAWQLLGKNDSVETVGRKEDEGRGPGRKAGICLTFFTGWEIVCKGIWRLAAGAMGCYRRLAIQNNSNQRVERRETFKNARGTPERFCFTLKHINAPLFAFCHKMHIFLSIEACKLEMPVLLYEPPFRINVQLPILSNRRRMSRPHEAVWVEDPSLFLLQFSSH